VIRLRRFLRCDNCMCPCCLQLLTVESPPDSDIGYVRQFWSLCKPYFGVYTSNGRHIFTIVGPFCTWAICGDAEFKVFKAGGDGQQVGLISKKAPLDLSELGREWLSDADVFSLSFKPGMDVRAKAVLLAATFLIDFMFFERSGRNEENDFPGMMDPGVFA